MKKIKSEPGCIVDWRSKFADYVTSIAWSPDGLLLGLSTADGGVFLLDVVHRCTRTLLEANGTSIDCLSFAANGQFLAAAGQAGKVYLWALPADDSSAAPLLAEMPAWIDRLVWHPQHPWLAFNAGSQVQVWQADHRQVVKILPLTNGIQDLQWHPEGKLLSVASKTQVLVWHCENWSEPQSLVLRAPAQTIAWSKNGVYLGVGLLDCTVLVWQWGKPYPWLMQGFSGKVLHLTWSEPCSPASNAPLLVAGSGADLITWEKAAHEHQAWNANLLDLHRDKITAVAFQPHKLLLASASLDGWLGLWHQAQGISAILQGAPHGFTALAWQPQGQKLAAGGHHGECMIWSFTPCL